MPSPTLVRGTLWPRLVRTTETALRRGALQPIPTRFERLQQGGVDFLVRTVSGMARKSAAHVTGEGRVDPRDRPNPFLPHDEELFVSDVSATHLGVLNKFNVVDRHLLIVTRRFEHQESLLTLEDFQALWSCMAEFDSLGFYNSGVVAGASQPHKHLQLVPLPLAPGGTATPVDPLLEDMPVTGGPSSLPALPFLHAAEILGPDLSDLPERTAAFLLDRYHGLLRAAGLLDRSDPGPSTRIAPYNLLLTRRWMLVVPRSHEHAGTISINALGFAGSLFVRNAEELAFLREIGPLTALGRVAPAR
jgi:ATP adenylyltransferase